MSSFIAAGTAYATHGVNTIPFFIYYSMFGFQRIGDLIWAAADSRTRGFLLGGTAGRTTLAGEGLQHQDGHSHVCSLSVPNCVSYDPAFAYEIAVIIQDGIRRMYENQESIFYYLTVMNEQYAMPPMPEGASRRHPEGALPLQHGVERARRKLRAQLLGSGAILHEVIGAQKLLEEVRRRRRRLERDQLPGALPRRPRVRALEHAAPGRDAARAVRDAVLQGRAGRARRRVRLREGAARLDRPLAAAPRPLARHRRLRPQRGRADLRDFFEVDARFVALATLAALAQDGQLDAASSRRRSRIRHQSREGESGDVVEHANAGAEC